MNGNFTEMKKIALDFKWGNITAKGGKIAKNDLLESFLTQPIVFNELGQPVQTLTLEITKVSKSEAYDPVTYPVKSDLTNYDFYAKKREMLPKAFDNIQSGDKIYIDNIEGQSPTMGSFKFSIVLEIE
jgi:hypothetical protein